MAVKNQLAKAQSKPTFSAYISSDAIRARINQMVGSKDGPRFITAVISAVSVNPELSGCDHASIVSCALLGEALGLSPSPQLGQYYMVPYEDKDRGLIAQFQLGYKGYIQLAIRSGYYKKINVLSIKEGELVKYDPLEEIIEVNLMDDEEAREAAPSIGYYAMFEYHNGFRKALYWSKAKMEAHALKYSKGYASDKRKGTAWTFWSKDFDGMAYKTMLRQLISKWGIMSIELQKAFESDTAVVNESGNLQFVEESQDVPQLTQDTEPAPDPEPAVVSEASFFD
jgi:recombination protein RecT